MATQHGRISVKVVVFDAFWHPAFGIVLLLLLRIGPRYTTLTAYYHQCEEHEASAIIQKAMKYAKPPNSAGN